MEPVNWYDKQWRTAIITKEGRKFMFVLVFDSGSVRLRRVKRSERRHMKPMMYNGEAYPVRRAVRKYRQLGRDYGITKGAYRALVEEPRQRVLDALAVKKAV